MSRTATLRAGSLRIVKGNKCIPGSKGVSGHGAVFVLLLEVSPIAGA